MKYICPAINLGNGLGATSFPVVTALGMSTVCIDVITSKHIFSLYLEGSERFLMKAIYMNKILYISSYERFDITPGQPVENCIAHMM